MNDQDLLPPPPPVVSHHRKTYRTEILQGTGTQNFAGGTYRFDAVTDDGVRLKIDGVTVIDKWVNGSSTKSYTGPLTAGSHVIVMEYYDYGSNARAILNWSKI